MPQLHREVVDGYLQVGLRNDETVVLEVKAVDAILQALVDAKTEIRSIDHVEVSPDIPAATASVNGPVEVHPELVHLVFVVPVVRGDRSVETIVRIVAIEGHALFHPTAELEAHFLQKAGLGQRPRRGSGTATAVPASRATLCRRTDRRFWQRSLRLRRPDRTRGARVVGRNPDRNLLCSSSLCYPVTGPKRGLPNTRPDTLHWRVVVRSPYRPTPFLGGEWCAGKGRPE